MSEEYQNVPLINIESTAASPKTLTASYVASGSHVIKHNSQLMLLVTYVPKTGQSNRNLSFKFQTADNASTPLWYDEILEETATGGSGEKVATGFDYIHKLPGATGGTSYQKRYPIAVSDNVFRIAFKEDGSANFGTVHIQVIKGGV